MRTIDFEKHNDEVRRTWEAYRAGKPTRVPVIFGINPRYTMWMPEANPRGITFQQYFEDPQLMMERQIEHQHWVRHHVPQDAEMGLPAKGWNVHIDFQNTYEAAWFGCGHRFYSDQVPDTVPFLDDAHKRALFDRGLPDPFSDGLMKRNWEFYEFMQARQAEGWTSFDRPIAGVSPTGLGTDGPMTVCCSIRGAAEFTLDLAADPEYARELLDFVTTGTIERIRAFRRRLGLPEKSRGWGFADDSIELLSRPMYEELVYPFHRRLVDALAEPGSQIGIHLCGDVERHLVFLRDHLNVRRIDTGFPIDHGRVRAALGDDVELLGGPAVPLLRYGTAQQVHEEVVRILQSGVMSGGKFILREGNNLAPDTPLENLWSMVDAAKKAGRYSVAA